MEEHHDSSCARVVVAVWVDRHRPDTERAECGRRRRLPVRRRLRGRSRQLDSRPAVGRDHCLLLLARLLGDRQPVDPLRRVDRRFADARQLDRPDNGDAARAPLPPPPPNRERLRLRVCRAFHRRWRLVGRDPGHLHREPGRVGPRAARPVAVRRRGRGAHPIPAGQRRHGQRRRLVRGRRRHRRGPGARRSRPALRGVAQLARAVLAGVRRARVPRLPDLPRGGARHRLADRDPGGRDHRRLRHRSHRHHRHSQEHLPLCGNGAHRGRPPHPVERGQRLHSCGHGLPLPR